MATNDELIAIRVAIQNAQKAIRDAHRVAAGIDEIGDEADEASRKTDKATRSINRLNAASSKTRVNIGPFSTSLRGVAIIFGGLVLAAEKLTPAVLSAGEAVAVLAGGGGAAGGVGLLALKQASTVATLGLGGFTEALGGSEEAARNLTPEAYELFRTLEDAKSSLKETAEAAMLPGLQRGGLAAMQNFEVLNGLVRNTGRELGRLTGDAGVMLGSKEWGRDVQTMGASNVRIIGSLGDAGLHLADAARHIVVEAGPLAEWLARNAEQGSKAAEAWAEGARKGGELRDFFRDSRTDMVLFASAIGNTSSALGNLFGNQDVSGTRFLEGLDQATQRFEDWTNSPAVRNDFGAAIRNEVADGVAAAAGAAAETLPLAAGRAAQVFWDAFWTASPEAKLLIGLVGGTKAFKMLRGSTPLTPMFTKEVGGGGGKGGGKKPTIIPPWLKGAGGAAARGATAAAPSAAAAALPAGLIAALVLGNNKNLPSGAGAGATAHGRAERGRPARNNAGAFDRVFTPSEVGAGNPNPLNPGSAFDPIMDNHITVKIGDETIIRRVERGTAKRRARKK